MSADRPPVAFVGAGRAAEALAHAMHAAGFLVRSVASTDGRSAARLAEAVAAGSALRGPAIAPDAELAILAVPDRSIAPIARSLATEIDGWSRRGVLHLAGSLGSEPLAPLAALGAATAVLHPFQVLGRDAVELGVLAGSCARVEGCVRGVALAVAVAESVGLHVLRIRTDDDAGRALYHAAASVAANDAVALWTEAVALLRRLGAEPHEAERAVGAIAAGVAAQVRRGGTASARTGPALRGDLEVVRRHHAALAATAPALAELHRSLAARLLEAAGVEGEVLDWLRDGG